MLEQKEAFESLIAQLENKHRAVTDKLETRFTEQMKKYREEFDAMEESELRIQMEATHKLQEALQESTARAREEFAHYDAKSKEYADKIAREQTRLSTLEFDKINDGKLLVLLGHTGSGKSTVGNRWCGDKSRGGTTGPFEVEHDYTSGPPLPSVKLCTALAPESVHVCDSGGFADVKGRDAEHTNNLCKFLQGCGGINAFVLVLNSQFPRLTGEIVGAIKAYEKTFGKAEMYSNLIIVATKVDRGYVATTYETEERGELLKQGFAECMNLIADGIDISTVPVIPFGADNFEDGLLQMKDAVARRPNKFGLRRLVSPLLSDTTKLRKFTEHCQTARAKLEEQEAKEQECVIRIQEISSRLNTFATNKPSCDSFGKSRL